MIDSLNKCIFIIGMNLENPWTVEPWHIHVALRKADIYAPHDAVSLNLPSPISGPNLDLENKEFVAELKVRFYISI